MKTAVEGPAFPLPSSNDIFLFQILFRILFLGWATLRKHRWVTLGERRSLRRAQSDDTDVLLPQALFQRPKQVLFPAGSRRGIVNADRSIPPGGAVSQVANEFESLLEGEKVAKLLGNIYVKTLQRWPLAQA